MPDVVAGGAPFGRLIARGSEAEVASRVIAGRSEGVHAREKEAFPVDSRAGCDRRGQHTCVEVEAKGVLARLGVRDGLDDVGESRIGSNAADGSIQIDSAQQSL